MKTTSNKTLATRDAVNRVEQIAKRQAQVAAIINKAAAEVQALEVENAQDERMLETLITRHGADVKAIAAALAKGHVRAGDMSSRLVDAIERRGQRAWPEPYEIPAKPWCIVSNTCRFSVNC